MKLLDGTTTSFQREKALKERIARLSRPPALAVVLVGEHSASVAYVRKKQEKCLQLGALCNVISLLETVSETDILDIIDRLNKDNTIDGILIQLPLPSHLTTRKILDVVAKEKDVDGLHSYHLMKILLDEEEIMPCTPKGIFDLLKEYNIPLSGKNVCVVGFSDVVGKPLATACLNRGATVTICHRNTKNLGEQTKIADIIMTATGVPKLITESMVMKGAVVVDIGINKIDGKIVGDVDFETVAPKTSFITPVPGGVGPMTVISLVENLLLLAEKYR